MIQNMYFSKQVLLPESTFSEEDLFWEQVFLENSPLSLILQLPKPLLLKIANSINFIIECLTNATF